MSRLNNGRWMLALAMLGSLVAPGVVAARQKAAPVQPAPTSSTALDLDVAAVEGLTLAPSVSACFNSLCTSTQQCRTWCDELSASCVHLPGTPEFAKYCVLP
jgi:hypothetical protein